MRFPGLPGNLFFEYHPGMTLPIKESESNPYDELPYLTFPVEWTAPENDL